MWDYKYETCIFIYLLYFNDKINWGRYWTWLFMLPLLLSLPPVHLFLLRREVLAHSQYHWLLKMPFYHDVFIGLFKFALEVLLVRQPYPQYRLLLGLLFCSLQSLMFWILNQCKERGYLCNSFLNIRGRFRIVGSL